MSMHIVNFDQTMRVHVERNVLPLYNLILKMAK